MYDLHCHMLPGIDDGARNMDEALSMAELAVADGVHGVVLTPHVHLWPLGKYACHDQRRAGWVACSTSSQ